MADSNSNDTENWDGQSPRQGKTMFERHLQTGLQLALVALLAWAGSEIVGAGRQIAVLEQGLRYQADVITDMRNELREWRELYYRKSTAEREHGRIEDMVHALHQRVSTLENKR